MDTKQNTKALILIFFIGIIGGGMGAVSILYMITWIQELLLVPDNYILFQFKDSYHYIITLYEMEFLILILMLMRKKILKKEPTKKIAKLSMWVKKHKLSIIAINIISFYICITSVSVVTETGIRDHSFYNPIGQSYTYSDIASVMTGFKGDGDKGIMESRGDFYYIVNFNDGKSIDYSYAACDNDKYELYEEVQDFDSRIMAMEGVRKISSSRNVQYNKYVGEDQSRLLTIIYNET